MGRGRHRGHPYVRAEHARAPVGCHRRACCGSAHGDGGRRGGRLTGSGGESGPRRGPPPRGGRGFCGVGRRPLCPPPFRGGGRGVGPAVRGEFRRAAVGLVGMLAFCSFLVYELAPLLKWPAWAANLSVQQLYGSPFLTGVFWNGLWAMLAVVVVGFGLATLLMQRREVGQ